MKDRNERLEILTTDAVEHALPFVDDAGVLRLFASLT